MVKELSLRGRHALVCGASAGIGRAAALALAEAGAAVTALARSEGKLQELLPQLLAAGADQARALAADMDDRAQLMARIDELVRDRGPVHILVHNTGGPASGPLLEKSAEDLLHTFHRHQITAHLMVQKLLPGMRRDGYGRIVLVLSTAAVEPIAGLGLSNTIRAGMRGWAKTLASELPPGVTINSVLPGYTATERLNELKEAISKREGRSPDEIEADWIAGIPEGRLGEPSEIGHAVLFLASPWAAYIRGQSLAVEGGRLKSF